jgi:hypothetical protein
MRIHRIPHTPLCHAAWKFLDIPPFLADCTSLDGSSMRFHSYFYVTGRVERKIVVFVFSRKFRKNSILLFMKIFLRKYKKIAKKCAKC